MDINEKFLGFNVLGGDPLGDLIDQLMQMQTPTYGSNSLPDEYYQNYLRNQGYMPDDVTRLLGQKQAIDAQNFETETRAFQNERDRVAQLTAEKVKMDQGTKQFQDEQARLSSQEAARIQESERERNDRMDAMIIEGLMNRLPENFNLTDTAQREMLIGNVQAIKEALRAKPQSQAPPDTKPPQGIDFSDAPPEVRSILEKQQQVEASKASQQKLTIAMRDFKRAWDQVGHVGAAIYLMQKGGRLQGFTPQEIEQLKQMGTKYEETVSAMAPEYFGVG